MGLIDLANLCLSEISDSLYNTNSPKFQFVRASTMWDKPALNLSGLDALAPQAVGTETGNPDVGETPDAVAS